MERLTQNQDLVVFTARLMHSRKSELSLLSAKQYMQQGTCSRVASRGHWVKAWAVQHWTKSMIGIRIKVPTFCRHHPWFEIADYSNGIDSVRLIWIADYSNGIDSMRQNFSFAIHCRVFQRPSMWFATIPTLKGSNLKHFLCLQGSKGSNGDRLWQL